jgi:hypothetical protein
VRELAIMHRGALQMLIEQKMEHLYHLRLAQSEGDSWEREIKRLESELWGLGVKSRPVKAITAEEAARNRKLFAMKLGLKVR